MTGALMWLFANARFLSLRLLRGPWQRADVPNISPDMSTTWSLGTYSHKEGAATPSRLLLQRRCTLIKWG